MQTCKNSGERAGGLHDRRGVTLLELMIATGLVALITTAICGVYFYAVTLWERGQALNSAYTSAVLAMNKIQHIIENAREVTIYSGGKEVMVRFPLATDSDGNYVPSVASGNPRNIGYSPGARVLLYKSDESGSRSASGDILWLANSSGSDWDPNETWSLYPETNKGRITQIESILFEAPSIIQVQSSKVANVTLVASEKRQEREYKVTLKRAVRLRYINAVKSINDPNY